MADVTWRVGDLILSGREAVPAGEPVATIVALHGGGYSAGYWDHPLDPAASLLSLGSSLGYRVVAIDRPGYGASHGRVGDEVRMARQAQIVLELIDGLRTGGGTGAGVFLIGHSMGAVLSLHIAADRRGGALAGMEISGAPFEFDDTLVNRAQLESLDFLPDTTVEFRRQLFYGPEGTFDPDIMEADAGMSRPIPAAEIIGGPEFKADAPRLAKSVTIPIQITGAEFEQSSFGDRESLERWGAWFSESPRVDLHWQVGSAHNISLHRVARAYHLRTIAFFDEILAANR